MSTTVSAGPIRRTARRGALALLALVLAGATLPAAAKTRCTDFSAYADGDSLAQRLRQDGYVFQFGGPSSVYGGGASFWADGASVKPPKAGGRWVELVLWPSAGWDIQLTGYDATGQIQATATVPITMVLTTVRLTSAGAPIVSVGLSGGGNESTLHSVCARL
jgi:hypothetical protein